MKTFKLNFSENLAQLAFGLVSAEKEYRICWQLNKELNIHFQRVNDHVITDNDGVKQPYPLFKFSNEDDLLTYFLLRNKNEGNVLAPELKLADYILIIEGEIWQVKPSKMKKQLNKAPSVQTVIPIEVNILKSRQNLIIDA